MTKSRKDQLYAVLTGDIVGSTRFMGTERKKLYDCITQASKKLVEAFPQSIPLVPAIFRGDSWQVLVKNPSKSLRIALYFRALLKSCNAGIAGKRIDSRIAIGIGTIDFLPPREVSSGDGEAYRLSGDGLDKMPKAHRMAISFPPRMKASAECQAMLVIIILIDSLAGKWTEGQARAVCGALLGYTQKATASKCFTPEISQQAVSQHLERAGWDSISPALDFFEAHIHDRP